jgi:hypothetical protein
MISIPLGRASAIAAVGLLLAGCGGSSQFAAPTTSGPFAPREASNGKATRNDLMYVSGVESSYLLSYPAGKLIGTIKGTAYGACSDASGDVFFPGQGSVSEYRHGSTKPVRTLGLPYGYNGLGCSVDPTTGNLAVTFLTNSGVAVFTSASGNATVLSTDEEPLYCGYDNLGNLFVDGGDADGLWLAELPKGSKTFLDISVTPSSTLNVGQLQWDGKYVTVQIGVDAKRPLNVLAIERLSISGSAAHVISETNFKNLTHGSRASWNFGNRILVPLGIHGGYPNIGLWAYPKGGSARKVIKRPAGLAADFTGLTISSSSDPGIMRGSGLGGQQIEKLSTEPGPFQVKKEETQ